MNTAKENCIGISKTADSRGMGNRVILSDIRNFVGVGHDEGGSIKKRPLNDKSPADIAGRPVRRKSVAVLENNSETYKQVTNRVGIGIINGNRDKPPDEDLDDDAPVQMMVDMENSYPGVEMVEDLDNETIPDIDRHDSDDPLAVVKYVEDVYAFYRQIEIESCVNPVYMTRQFDINEKMRAILIDWLIEVHYKFELMEETLFLIVNIIDRFLEKQTVERKKLQLVGVAALLLACKYEEVSVPEVQDLVYITDRLYTREEVLEMEILIANKLQFNMSLPTPYVFMIRFLKAAESDKELEMLALFILELCLVEYQMLKFRPSLLAAAAIFTAQCTLAGHNNWTRTCKVYTSYSEDQLLECSTLMVDLHQKAGLGKLLAVVKKHSDLKCGCTAKSVFLLGNH